MLFLRPGALALCAFLVAIASTEAAAVRMQAQNSVAAPDAQGRDLVQRKCAQCHAASMWTALRQDRRAWESTLYRMVGRGALWTPEEINAMADYLTQIRGPVK